ncbi:MAG: adenylate/guanylate cyclase domain-containing protein [Ilumatobacter sp.]|uniref:ATP-binding protein n=2 Tax=Ilumatobacter sp. TaxID=1967498 RepID=UPI002A34165B|nr:adenylate/guanylate cyclase domain-containing protein [Ilumatobacter sp.]MBT7428189.1 adenylate/guanylate cyclase domain-containing protein [Ilumatobacter sp.]MDG0975285.1 adenylate/guanylate cyclase domain-containing protein [Ilumatobacter sp.]
MAEYPSGTVTFLFTDVEGSTRLWEEHPDEMRLALERHDELLRSAIASFNGYVFSTAGDSFAAGFHSAGDAVGGALAAQAALASESWPAGVTLRVRMGLHVGEAHEREGDYFGPAVNTAARIMSAGHGGQILASAAVVSIFDPSESSDLGENRLKDLTAARQLWQLGVGEFPPLRTLNRVSNNLPVERTVLLGRDVEVAEIAEMLAQHRLVTLLGMGGTGKTRLASAVAADVAHDFADGAWFVDLVPTSGADQAAEAIATAMGLQLAGADLVAALANLVADRELLVVLDNCEHITDDVADVVDALLERTSRLRLLATSREPLQLPDERQVQVPPLDVTDGLASPAVQLFLTAAERVGAEVPPEEIASVTQICAHLDGLPLAVELAAAQLRQLGVGELADRLDQRFELLARGRRQRGRQSSLQAVLEDTWRCSMRPKNRCCCSWPLFRPTSRRMTPRGWPASSARWRLLARLPASWILDWWHGALTDGIACWKRSSFSPVRRGQRTVTPTSTSNDIPAGCWPAWTRTDRRPGSPVSKSCAGRAATTTITERWRTASPPPAEPASSPGCCLRLPSPTPMTRALVHRPPSTASNSISSGWICLTMNVVS